MDGKGFSRNSGGGRMNKIAALSAQDRRALFEETGARKGLPPFHVEKDFWVCWVLNVLFNDPVTGSNLTFRGGTSLSKGWGIIERFSEDIDLAMSREWVGDGKDAADPGITQSEKERRLRALRNECREVISSCLYPVLETAAIKTVTESFQLELEPLKKARDPFCIHFHYPSTELIAPEEYNRPAVKIELSGRAERWPKEDRTIMPYAAEEFPDLFQNATLTLSCVRPERTFWEKAALIHEQNVRSGDRPLAVRQARHIYDLVRLWNHISMDAHSELRELFDDVKTHRQTFFNYKWVDYNKLTTAGLCLSPPAERLSEWRADYEAMSSMFFKIPPRFEDLLKELKRIEKTLIP